jgi:hypothetical protein
MYYLDMFAICSKYQLYLAVSKVLAREFFMSDYVIMSCSFHFSVAFLFRQ